jgi:hypothetical protein
MTSSEGAIAANEGAIAIAPNEGAITIAIALNV